MSLPCQVSDPGWPRAGTVPNRQTSRPVAWSSADEETVRAMLPARDARNQQIAGRQRRGGRRVVLPPVGERGVPQQGARQAIEREDVRVVGLHEHAIARDGGAAIRVALDDALGAGPLIVPDLRARVPASSAKHSFGAVTYMMPAATTGVPWSDRAFGMVNIHRGPSRATVVLSICVSAV